MDILGLAANSLGSLTNTLGTGQARFELRAGIFVDRELEVLSFEGVEKLNTPFVYDVTFATSVDEGELHAEVFGFPACLTIYVPDHDARVIQGIAVGLEAVGESRSDDGSERRTFSVRIVPPLWLLNHTSCHRVFQNRSALEIAATLLSDSNIPVTVFPRASNHAPIPFVYQHGESDLAFLERILATAGIFYYFEHSTGLLSSLVPSGASAALDPARSVGPVTKLVLCDAACDTEAMTDASAGGPGSGGVPNAQTTDTGVGYLDGDPLPFDPDGHTKGSEHVSAFKLRKEIRPGAVYVQDWDLRRSKPILWDGQVPAVACTVSTSADGSPVHKVAGFDSDTLSTAVGADALTVIEYQRDGSAIGADSASYPAKRALAQVRSDWAVARGASDCARLAPGYRFALTSHPVGSLNREYLLTEVSARGCSLDHLPTSDAQVFVNNFVCVPSSVDPIPPKPALRPARGPEPAEVIGPVRDEINTDDLGRIQVRFRWSQSANTDNPTSGVCWVEWLERWGGDGYGTMSVPRVGSEVWVEFPEQSGGSPIAVGQVRSASNRPPFQLTEDASKVGIRTNRLPPGGTGYSEISIQDRTGGERVHIRAERDMDVQVLHDSVETIGHDRDVQVAKHDSLRVGQSAREAVRNDKHLAVGGSFITSVGGNMAVTAVGRASDVVIGNRTVQTSGSVDESSRTRTIGVEGDFALSVDGASRSTVGTPQTNVSSDVIVYGNHSLSATGSILISGDTSIILQCGTTRIELKEGTLAAFAKALSATVSTVDVEADDKVTVVATNTTELRGQTVRLISKGASLELTDGASLQGSSVKLGSSAASASSQSNSSTDPTKVAFTATLVDSTGAAIAGANFHLYYDGVKYEGTTDGSGGIQQPLVQVPDARIYLRVWTSDYPKTRPLEYDITWETIPPISSDAGVLVRLRNQGFFRGAIPIDQPDVVTAMKQEALINFIRATMKVIDPESPEHESKALQLLATAHGH